MVDLAKPRARAAEQAYGLGIALYLSPEGRVEQSPPEGETWERIEPPKGAVPIGHGHGKGAEAKSIP